MNNDIGIIPTKPHQKVLTDQWDSTEAHGDDSPCYRDVSIVGTIRCMPRSLFSSSRYTLVLAQAKICEICIAQPPGEVGKTVGQWESVRNVPIDEIVLSRIVDDVEIYADGQCGDGLEVVVERCRYFGLDVKVFPCVDDNVPEITSVGDANSRGLEDLVKTIAEYGLAVCLTLLFLPLMVIVGIAIKLSSPGPVFFAQRRTGKNGRLVRCYKFRTMILGADGMREVLEDCNEMRGGGRLFKMDNDPRVTPIGKLLRITSIDEFPQLFNVLRGDLSLVGPRILSTPLNEYEPEYRRRLSVRQGIMCLWQVGRRGDSNYREWMRSDLDYLDRWSLWLDLKVLLSAVWSVLTKKGAR